MIERHNRKLNHINGMLNMCTHLFGVNFMCRIKYVMGKIRGRKFKKDMLIELDEYIKKGLPHAGLMSADEKAEWNKAFRHLLDQSNDMLHWNMIYEFYHAQMEMLKDFETVSDGEPILLCAERNEILRIEKFMEYYRALGVERFLILDNDSSDGTREYLLKQPDVRVYSCATQYNAQRKSAWQNRMVADYGLNHWYLYVDADEFLWYPEADKLSLKEYTAKLFQKKLYGVKALMIEMYPKGTIGSDEYNGEDFLEKYIYFDGDSEFYVYDSDTNSLYGGMLSRIFDQQELLRTKIPLYYHTNGRFLVGSHHIFPLREDISFSIGAILKHYKFLPGDYEKVKEAIEKKNYANHSMMYKKYIKFYDGNKGISAFSEYSCKWTPNAADEFKMIKHLGG